MALKAKSNSTLEFAAPLLEIGTLLVAGSATYAIRHSDAFAFHVVFHGKVACAEGTVHAAGRNQLGAVWRIQSVSSYANLSV